MTLILLNESKTICVIGNPLYSHNKYDLYTVIELKLLSICFIKTRIKVS